MCNVNNECTTNHRQHSDATKDPISSNHLISRPTPALIITTSQVTVERSPSSVSLSDNERGTFQTDNSSPSYVIMPDEQRDILVAREEIRVQYVWNL